MHFKKMILENVKITWKTVITFISHMNNFAAEILTLNLKIVDQAPEGQALPQL